MTSRRDFLRSFGAIVTGIVLAPATALAAVQRLGTPADWVPPVGPVPGIWRTVKSGNWADPSVWDQGTVPDASDGFIDRIAITHDTVWTVPGDHATLHIGTLEVGDCQFHMEVQAPPPSAFYMSLETERDEGVSDWRHSQILRDASSFYLLTPRILPSAYRARA